MFKRKEVLHDLYLRDIQLEPKWILAGHEFFTPSVHSLWTSSYKLIMVSPLQLYTETNQYCGSGFKVGF